MIYDEYKIVVTHNIKVDSEQYIEVEEPFIFKYVNAKMNSNDECYQKIIINEICRRFTEEWLKNQRG